jgi:ferredoxin-NADP reductase
MGEITRKAKNLSLPITRIVDDTPTVRDFKFDLDGHDFDFVPGQFVTLTTDVPGHGPVTRAYSIASAPTQRDSFDLCIKLFPDGILSRFMFDHVEPGFRFRVKGPFGKFVWNEDLGGKLALIGAGTGIAPLQCMIRYARDKELGTDIGLLFSNKKAEEIIYREELDGLARTLPGFKVAYTITRGAPEGWTGYARRIDRDMIAEVFPDVKERVCYLCGAPEMVNASIENLRALGVPEENIRSEKYY